MCLANPDLCRLRTLVCPPPGAPGSCHFLALGRQIQASAHKRQYLNPGAASSVSWLPSAWDANCFPFVNSALFLLPISFCSQFSISLEKCDSNSSCVTPSTVLTSCFQLPGSAEMTFGISWLPARNPTSSQHLFKHRASGGNALCLSNLFVI